MECKCPCKNNLPHTKVEEEAPQPEEELYSIETQLSEIENRPKRYIDAVRPEFRYGGFRIGEHQMNYT